MHVGFIAPSLAMFHKYKVDICNVVFFSIPLVPKATLVNISSVILVKTEGCLSVLIQTFPGLRMEWHPDQPVLNVSGISGTFSALKRRVSVAQQCGILWSSRCFPIALLTDWKLGLLPAARHLHE